MAADFLDYPKGRFALGAGDLIDVYDVNIAIEDGEKIVATLRQNPAGSTSGTKSSVTTFKSAISEAGFERDFMGKYEKREVVETRLKVPGLVFTSKGRFTKPQILSNVDGFIDFTIGLIGRTKTTKG
jgi:hypothetical protein